jgi:hypothetical protein
MRWLRPVVAGSFQKQSIAKNLAGPAEVIGANLLCCPVRPKSGVSGYIGIKWAVILGKFVTIIGFERTT